MVTYSSAERSSRSRLVTSCELQQDYLHQLVAYALLDYDDHYRISDIGMYSCRYAVLVRWPFADVLGWLADAPVAIPAIRAALRAHLASC